MITIHATSDKTKEDVDRYFENKNLYDSLMRGFNEALDYEKGNTAGCTTTVRTRDVPETDVSALRRELGMTRSDFAYILGVTPKTIEAWEMGKRTPSRTARNLMYLLSLDHTLTDRLDR